jgi:hypothetical protein
MFDLRYHVISLVAVFLALVLGILVGVAISDPELANRTELIAQRAEIARLNDRIEAAADRSAERDAAERFVDSAYRTVMHDRLVGKQVLVVFVGPVDGTLADAVRRAATDAGAEEPPLRALALPLRLDAIQAVLEGRPALAGYRGADHLSDLGRDLGRELVDGGETPLWDALETTLVEQRRGALGEVDAVVVARTVKPQGGDTARFLLGLYEGLRAGAPVVGIEKASAEPTAVATFRRVGFSTVTPVDSALGRMALAVVLAGAAPGHYGIQADGRVQLPAIAPVEPPPTTSE